MIIHTFLYESAFLDSSSVLDPIRKTGGLGVLSGPSLSYFVTPEEFIDPRIARADNLNAALVTKPRLIIDQAQYPQVLTDIQATWTDTERKNLFSIIDQLCFSYAANATADQVELALSAWPQYQGASFVYSNTTTTATVYLPNQTVQITCPDYVTFTFVTAGGTQYQLRVWLSNAKFYQGYPLSTIGVVVPPLPLDELYTLSITTSMANVFTTALASSHTSQQDLNGYIMAGDYSGYFAQSVAFVDGNGNTAAVQFNILYSGAVPGANAIRAAVRSLLLSSDVGTSDGWKAIAPELFVTEQFFLLPMWEDSTLLINTSIHPSVIELSQATGDAVKVLHDIPSGFITANLGVIWSTYDDLIVLAVPDQENDTNRLSLAAEHPSYRAIPSTSTDFQTMVAKTRQFAALFSAALAVAAGIPSTNPALNTYTPPGDTRTYITFSVDDVTYQVMTEASYLAAVNAP